MRWGGDNIAVLYSVLGGDGIVATPDRTAFNIIVGYLVRFI